MVTYESEPKPVLTSSPTSPRSRNRQIESSVTDTDDDDFMDTASVIHVPEQINETNAIHYQITRDDPNFKKLSLHPLRSQFAEFAGLRLPNNNKKPDQADDDGVERIHLFGIEAWFTQAKIFTTPLCRITLHDVKTMFWRGQKQALTFKEFECFIEDLAEFRKIHPDTIVFRLRLCGSPELEARLSHLTVPEGTVDLVIDIFRLEAADITEEFRDLSKIPYEEPVCFGGVPRGRKAEKVTLKAKATNLMKKGDPTEKMDPLYKNFIYFAKNGNYYSDGRTIELTQLIKWMKQAEIINGDTISSLDIGFLYKKLYGLTWRIYYDDLLHFLRELASWKEVPRKTLVQKLRNCEPPASSSVTIISLTLPESSLKVLKSALTDYAGNYEENRDLYEPTSADGPFGHTPNSRNRHFQNLIEERVQNAHFTPMGVKRRSKQLRRHNNSLAVTKKQTTDDVGNDREEAFSEEKRGGKDHTTKRWNDAYPIGGEGNHRARIEPELEKLMFGSDRADESSDEEVAIKRNYFRSHDMSVPSTYTTTYTFVPLEEQFEKFRNFGEHVAEDEGISLKNIQLWFNLAGMLVRRNSLFTTHHLENIFKQFKFAQEHNWLDYDNFLNFLDALTATSKKKAQIKEIKERLSRCGPPRRLPSQQLNFIEPKRKNTADDAETSDNESTSKTGTDLLQSRKETISKEEEKQIVVNEAFEHRFQEYSRFGEPTVPDAYTIPGLSMVNADKWIREANLFSFIYMGEVDVLYKQLYTTKQRLSLQEFCKLVKALYETIENKASITFEGMIQLLVDCGPPRITELSASSS